MTKIRIFIAAGMLVFFLASPLRAETGGYEGLIAPEAPSPAEESRPSSGYDGVLAPPAQMTSAPAVKTHQDLQLLSTIYGSDRNGDGVPDSLAQPKTFSGTVPPTLIDQKTPMENMVARNISYLQSVVKDKSLSPADRQEKARQSYHELSILAQGLRQKKSTPDRIYQKMGLSDDYIRDDKSGVSHALGQLDKALADYKQYQ